MTDDPSVGGADDATQFLVSLAIPTLGGFGLALQAAGLIGAAMVLLRRRQRV